MPKWLKFYRDFEKALKLINVARDAGADEKNFNCSKLIIFIQIKWTLRDFKSIELNPNWLSKFKNYAEKLNLDLSFLHLIKSL